MPYPVRSRRLFGPILVGANPQTLYTTPAGRTALFRAITCAHSGAAVLTLGVRVNGSGAGTAIWFGTIAPASTLTLGEEYVLDPGDSLIATAGTLSVVTMAGFGSLLDGAPE